MTACLENKRTKASVHRTSVPQLKCLSAEGLHEGLGTLETVMTAGLPLPAEPDAPDAPPSGLLHVGFSATWNLVGLRRFRFLLNIF